MTRKYITKTKSIECQGIEFTVKVGDGESEIEVPVFIHREIVEYNGDELLIEKVIGMEIVSKLRKAGML